MKKVLLSLMVGAGLAASVNAQTVYFEENFDNLTEIPLGWTNIDADGDGATWYVAQIVDDSNQPVFTPLLRSASWSQVALNPDNWIITPAISLADAASGESIELHYDINAVDPNWDAENYTVYVATSADPTDLEASSISFNENTLDGFNEFNENSGRVIDISALAGETVYVAFRHHDVSDQFTIELDNIQVVGETLSVSEVGLNKSKLMIASVGNGEFKLQLPEGFDAEKTQIEVYNTLGSVVATTDFEQFVNLSKLPTGVYIIKANDGKETAVTRFIKK